MFNYHCFGYTVISGKWQLTWVSLLGKKKLLHEGAEWESTLETAQGQGMAHIERGYSKMELARNAKTGPRDVASDGPTW